MAAKEIVVGSWPGYGPVRDDFIAMFLDGIASAGCKIVSVKNVCDIGPQPMDILVLHWVDRIFWDSRRRSELAVNIFRFLKCLARLRSRTKIVWVVHNLEPHDMPPNRRIFWRVLTRILPWLVDGVLTLSPGTIPVVQSAFPGLRKLPIGYFWPPESTMPEIDPEDRQKARRARGIPDDTFLIGYVGRIRPYKGIDALIAGFRSSTSDRLMLFLAGQNKGYSEANIGQMTGGDERIIVELGNLPYSRFNEALSCCDLIVAPLRTYLHSGSIVHALSARRRVLTPRTPFSESLASEVGPEWVRVYEGDLTGKILDAEIARHAPVRAPRLGACSQAALAENVSAFLRDVLAGTAALR